MDTDTITRTQPAPIVPSPTAAGVPNEDDGSVRALRCALRSIGLEPPSAALLTMAGAPLWLRLQMRSATPPVLDGLHPNRLLRMCFALDIWALRSHLLSPNLLDFLIANARPELPIVVDLDPRRWSATATGDACPEPTTNGLGPVARMVVTRVEAAPAGDQIVGFGPDGVAGAWPAVRVMAAARMPHPDAPAGVATLHQLLVRRLQVDPAHCVRFGLRRVVGQMRRSIPDFGVTGLAAFSALRTAIRAGLRPRTPTPADLGRGTFADALTLAADMLAQPSLATAASRLRDAAEVWRAVTRPTGGHAVPPLVVELERLERDAVEEIAAALTPATKIAVHRTAEPASAAPVKPHLDAYDHRRGVHCASMALHNLARHHLGCKWNESLCFGLAAGLNFTYLREPGSPLFLLMGRGSDMEEHFADAVGAHLETFRSDDGALAHEHLLQHLEAGRLVVLEVDMFHLPYMVSSLELMKGVHFGGHKLFVTGHDPRAGTVTVHDYAWKEPIVLPLAQLWAARGSRDCPEPPRHGAFVFHFPEQATPLDEAILRALRTLVQQMRHPFMQWNGLPAIDRFCRQVARWARVMAPNELELNLRLAAFMFERAGTGGGNFRNLYHRFLRQAAELLDAPELAAAAEGYRRLAAAWRQVAALLDEAADDPARGIFDPARQPQRLLDEIRRMERWAVATIDDFLHQREGL